MTRREIIVATLTDSVTDLLFYDRKEDESLPINDIEEAIQMGELTIEDMIEVWGNALGRGLNQ